MSEFRDTFSKQSEIDKTKPLAIRASRLGISPEGKSDHELMAAIVEFRNNQFSHHKACEYVTGMLPDDPRLLDRFAEDQLIIRQKYGLPSVGVFKNDPAEYEKRIREAAKKEGIDVINCVEQGKYFKQFPMAEAVSLGGRIAVDVRNDGILDEYKDGLRALEHEYVHEKQRQQYPDLPPELQEYEAYLIGLDVNKMKGLSPDDRAFVVFCTFFWGSVNRIYERIGQEPVWKNPEWFLKNIDGIEVPS